MSDTLRPRRSALYMPGANARAIDKGRSLPADAIVLDLEDSVAPEAKAVARRNVIEAVKAGGYGRREIVVRINSLNLAEGRDDLQAISAIVPDAVVIPKVANVDEVMAASAAIAASGMPERTRLWAMIETPIGIVNVAAIAAAAKAPGARLACLVVGLNDLVKETRATLGPDRLEALHWLSSTVTAARAYGIDVLDSVCNDFRDAAKNEREARQGRALGFTGKSVIHPSQLEIVNAVYGPSSAQIDEARKIVAAFALPDNRGKGVINLDGKMVELLHAESARRMLAIAEAIAKG